MSFIAIVGAGAVGGALAYRLASVDRLRDVRLIDAEDGIARGKALDILQSAPVEGFSTRISGHASVDAAAGADVVVIADTAKGDVEHGGETGLATLRRIASLDARAPIVFAGASQRQLMTRVVAELHVAPRRVLGSAPGALESAVRALTALECDGSGVEAHLRILGVPPEAALIAWEEGSVLGQPVSAVVPPHRLAALSARLPRLWPPGPFALAAAAARTADAIVNGSRRSFTCFVSIEQPPYKGAVVAMPVRLGSGGVERVLQPALTRQERTSLENGLALS
jgi:malate dehydrogenase